MCNSEIPFKTTLVIFTLLLLSYTAPCKANNYPFQMFPNQI